MKSFLGLEPKKEYKNLKILLIFLKKVNTFKYLNKTLSSGRSFGVTQDQGIVVLYSENIEQMGDIVRVDSFQCVPKVIQYIFLYLF